MPKFTPLRLNPGLSGQSILVALLTSLATTSRLQWLQMGNCSMSRAKLTRSLPPVHLGPGSLSPASLGAESKVKTQMFTLLGGMQGLRDTGSSGAQGGMWPGDSLWWYLHALWIQGLGPSSQTLTKWHTPLWASSSGAPCEASQAKTRRAAPSLKLVHCPQAPTCCASVVPLFTPVWLRVSPISQFHEKIVIQLILPL